MKNKDLMLLLIWDLYSETLIKHVHSARFSPFLKLPLLFYINGLKCSQCQDKDDPPNFLFPPCLGVFLQLFFQGSASFIRQEC